MTVSYKKGTETCRVGLMRFVCTLRSQLSRVLVDQSEGNQYKEKVFSVFQSLSSYLLTLI
jgi:hypothetical protein